MREAEEFWDELLAQIEAGEIIPVVGPELLTVRHGITRYQITMVCFEAEYAGGAFRSAFYRQGRWLAPEELPAYPASAPQRRLARALSHPGHQRRLF